MKIVYLADSIIPSRSANSIHVMKMCQAFAKNWHNVMLFVPDKSDRMEKGVDDPFIHYGINPCFHLSKLYWPSIKGRRYIYGYLSARAAAKVNPDIVISRYLPSAFFATKLGLPVIFESHFPISVSGSVSRWMFLQLIKNKNLKKLVVITHALKEYYQECYPAIASKIQVSPDGADPVPRHILPVGLPNRLKRFKVGYIGHLYKGKGVEIIIKLASLCPDMDFHVVGGTEEDILFFSQECVQCDNLVLHGYVPHADTIKYITAFDVALIPNQRAVKTFSNKKDIGMWTSPLKVFEYMAAGKAIICSDLPVLREILRHEENALLCPPEDVSAWVQALECLRADSRLRHRLCAQAQNDFLKNYTWQVRAKNLLGNIS